MYYLGSCKLFNRNPTSHAGIITVMFFFFKVPIIYKIVSAANSHQWCYCKCLRFNILKINASQFWPKFSQMLSPQWSVCTFKPIANDEVSHSVPPTIHLLLLLTPALRAVGHLDSIPAVMRWRQGYNLCKLPVHCRAVLKLTWCCWCLISSEEWTPPGYFLQGISNGSLLLACIKSPRETSTSRPSSAATFIFL